MCKHCEWQCEATWSLVDDGAFTLEERWDPAKTNWTQVYDIFHRNGYWDDSSKPLLMDKSPPNTGKAAGLVEYFETHGHDYRMIAMARHPCMYDHTQSYEPHDLNILSSLVPSKKLFTLSYNDLVTKPADVAQALLKWLPELESLDIDKSYIHDLIVQGKRARGEHVMDTELAGRDDSMLAYANSQDCSLEIKHASFRSESVPPFASCRWC
jgi:hypothetical protein